MPNLDMTLTITTEEREDRWAVFVKELAFTVYGVTEQEAQNAVEEAVTVLLNSFDGDAAALQEFLRHRNVAHVLNEDIAIKTYEQSAPPKRHLLELRGREVPLAVAI